MVEHTDAQDQSILIQKPVKARKNVAPRGEDIKAGDIIVEAGTVLNPGRLGALAAVGRATILVYEKPTAVVIPTGGEVVPPGSGPLKPGQIYDINTTTLLSALGEFGAAAVGHPVVEDDMDSLRQAVDGAAESDFLVLTGGSSVGERDLLADVLAEVCEISFHGLAVKPGKPTMLARRAGSRQIIVGMPGYPTSCLSNAYLLLGPLVARLGRRSAPRLQTVELPLAGPAPASSGRLQVFTVSIHGGHAHPAYKTSGAITSMSQADGYIEVPSDSPGLEAGTTVTVKLF
jgi:molybdenum cofactor synthesis domain-containing protein